MAIVGVEAAPAPGGRASNDLEDVIHGCSRCSALLIRTVRAVAGGRIASFRRSRTTCDSAGAGVDAGSPGDAGGHCPVVSSIFASEFKN
jgi:hypothetical protein